MKHFNLTDLDFVINKYGINMRNVVAHDYVTIKNLFLNPGDTIPFHQVPVDVTFVILKGTGSITIGEETEPIKEGDIVQCPPNTPMSVQANDEEALTFLNIKTPGYPRSK